MTPKSAAARAGASHPATLPRALPPAAASAPQPWPAFMVFGCSLAVGLMLSAQYLTQPFVWRNWPWDEVLAGWLEVARDRVVVASAIAVAIVAANRLPATSLGARAAALALAFGIGDAAGELALRMAGVPEGWPNLPAVLGNVAHWSIIGAIVAVMWQVWRSAADASAAAQALELRRAQLESQATEARLGALRGQIEPHFLFNTLATVRRLQQVDPAQGAQLLAHFVIYLRSAQPAGDAAGNTLGQEIDLVRAYLGVVAQRMDGRLKFSVDVDDALRAQPFPALTIATLVENAVKHGIAPAATGGAISVRVRLRDATIEAVVDDTGVGFSGASGSGIGLANIRARLNTLYGSAGSLTLQANRPSGVRAALRLPCATSLLVRTE